MGGSSGGTERMDLFRRVIRQEMGRWILINLLLLSVY